MQRSKFGNTTKVTNNVNAQIETAAARPAVFICIPYSFRAGMVAAIESRVSLKNKPEIY
jgi:hypothetical protein